jgi:hypothetical protein
MCKRSNGFLGRLAQDSGGVHKCLERHVGFAEAREDLGALTRVEATI